MDIGWSLLDLGGSCWTWKVPAGRSDLLQLSLTEPRDANIKVRMGARQICVRTPVLPQHWCQGGFRRTVRVSLVEMLHHKYPPSFLAWAVRLVQDRKLMTEDEGQPVASAVLNQRKNNQIKCQMDERVSSWETLLVLR